MDLSISILGYEDKLSLVKTVEYEETINIIDRLIDRNPSHHVHIDVVRPSLVSDTIRFNTETLRAVIGHFSGNASLGIHLMTKNPMVVLQQIDQDHPQKDRKKTTIYIQLEYTNYSDKLKEILNDIEEMKFQPGIAIDLPTPVTTIPSDLFQQNLQFLVMSVPIGYGGQTFTPESVEKIRYIKELNPKIPIGVDGGIHLENLGIVASAGATLVIIGSYITNNPYPEKVVGDLAREIEKH